jgi:hypothetical protein
VKGANVPYKWVTIIVLTALPLAAFATSEYVRARGISYLEQGQAARHQAVLDLRAGDPWQYRVLAPYMIDDLIGFLDRLGIPHHVAVSFILFRVVQDALILLLAAGYYRQLGLSLPNALLGMILLAWGMSYSHYDSDLQFNTFFDIIFYLLAGWCVLQGRFAWIVPIAMLAALNRETSGLIPFLPLAVTAHPLRDRSARKLMPVCAAALLGYAGISVALRLLYVGQEYHGPYGHVPGLDLLWYNLSRTITWQQLVATLSVIPLMALLGWQRWPRPLKGFFLAIVPVWVVVHAFAAVMAESRLFLVPQAMVFIPGALFLAQRTEPLPRALSILGEAPAQE